MSRFPTLTTELRTRAAILHASAAWGSSEDGALMDFAANQIDVLRGSAAITASSLQEVEDALEEAISDSLDMDWRPRDAARIIMDRLYDIGLRFADNVAVSEHSGEAV